MICTWASITGGRLAGTLTDGIFIFSIIAPSVHSSIETREIRNRIFRKNPVSLQVYMKGVPNILFGNSNFGIWDLFGI